MKLQQKKEHIEIERKLNLFYRENEIKNETR